MENIIVVSPISTGKNFIEDIIYRGYNPIALITKSVPGAAVENLHNESIKEIEYPFDTLDEKDTYEETLKLVQELNPVVIVPGSENGVILANKLAADLGLKGNPINILDKMTKKMKCRKL